MKPLTHLQQTDETCVHTCIAMLLNNPNIGVDQVSNYAEGRFGKPGGLHTDETCMLLKELRIRHNLFLGDSLIAPGWYILTVPSLNIEGGLHAILVRGNSGDLDQCLDPQAHRENKKYYVIHDPENDFEVKLTTWAEPIYVIPKDEGNIPNWVISDQEVDYTTNPPTFKPWREA